jgi:hypothetical protein
MFSQKPDPVAARKELNSNLTLFAISVIAVRASTYLLDVLQQSQE